MENEYPQLDDNAHTAVLDEDPHHLVGHKPDSRVPGEYYVIEDHLMSSRTWRDEGEMQRMFAEFSHLVDVWKSQTGHLSNITKKCTHPAYQQIIGMGKAVIPLILRDLKRTQADWFWALAAITGENPIPASDAGYVNRMTKAWMAWGEKRGYDA